MDNNKNRHTFPVVDLHPGGHHDGMQLEPFWVRTNISSVKLCGLSPSREEKGMFTSTDQPLQVVKLVNSKMEMTMSNVGRITDKELEVLFKVGWVTINRGHWTADIISKKAVDGAIDQTLNLLPEGIFQVVKLVINGQCSGADG